RISSSDLLLRSWLLALWLRIVFHATAGGGRATPATGGSLTGCCAPPAGGGVILLDEAGTPWQCWTFYGCERNVDTAAACTFIAWRCGCLPLHMRCDRPVAAPRMSDQRSPAQFCADDHDQERR